MEERNCPMEDPFAFLTLNFLKKSEIFPGSLGTFRYRFQRTGKVNAVSYTHLTLPTTSRV